MNKHNDIIDFGVCRLALVAVRTAPNHESAMSTQLLFGDHYTVIDISVKKEWLRIIIHFDGSEGWIDGLQHHSITKEYFDQINHANFKITTDLSCSILYKKNPITILMGSIVPISNSELFKIEEQFAFNGEAKSLGQKRDIEFIKSVALKYHHAPHIHGGKSPFGIDAAGLVQMVYKISGYLLPHNITRLLSEGKAVSSINEVLPGDIVFFSQGNEVVSHVGLILGDNKIIHSHGRVRIDHITEDGILSPESKVFTHYLKEIRRIVSA